jgi:hypothetical protein
MSKPCGSSDDKNIIRMIKLRWMGRSGYVARMQEMRNAYKYLAGKREGKKPLGRKSHRWQNTVKEIWYEDVDWIHMKQDRNSGGTM